MINLIIGVFFILGGLTGTMVLKGTGSSMGLAVFGVILVIWGIVQMKSEKKSGKRVTRRIPRHTGASRMAKAKARTKRPVSTRPSFNAVGRG